MIEILLTIFVSIALGFALARIRKTKISPEPFVAVIMDVFMPALVFSSLLADSLPGRILFKTGISAALVILMLWVICLLAGKITGDAPGKFALPVMFMNTGFMGIPLIKMLYGSQAVSLIVIYDQVQTLFIFTLGIYIARGNEDGNNGKLDGIVSIFREPLFYTIISALLLKTADVTIPALVLGPIKFVGDITPALALFTLGIRLAGIKLKITRSIVTSIILRFGGGYLCGSMVVWFLNLEGVVASVVVIASLLPSAVLTYIISERVGSFSEEVSSTVLLTTLISVPLLPVIIHFLQ